MQKIVILHNFDIMAGNSFGDLFRITSFGESHGPYIGGVVDGCPAGISIDFNAINEVLRQRQITSKRQESNTIEWLSGLMDGKTTGAPIAFIVPNKNMVSADYKQDATLLKPSHANYVYWKKYGIFDYWGSGRASGRETVVRVVAGCIAKQYLSSYNIDIKSYTIQIGEAVFADFPNMTDEAEHNILHCPSESVAKKMLAILEQCNQKGDTIGCKIGCIVKNLPLGLGEPVFDKLSADLSKACMSINAAKAFEYGVGFKAAQMYGSQCNDLYNTDFSTKTNHNGGILAGISNGELLYFTVAFKPIPTIMQNQQTVDIHGNMAVFQACGRHDVCVSPKVLSVVEAMTAICLINHLLKFKAYQNDNRRS